jgi:hypothetical protein
MMRLRMLLGGLALVSVALLGVGDVLAQAAWQTVRPPGMTTTIEMPAAPQYKEQQGKSGAGTTFYFHSYTLDFGERSFVFQTAIYPADVGVSAPRTNLQAAADASGKHMRGGKWDKVTWIQYRGAPSVELIGTEDDGTNHRMRFILKGSQMISVGYSGPAGALSPDEAERFFKSLRLQ